MPLRSWLTNSFELSHEKNNMKIVDIKTKLIFIKKSNDQYFDVNRNQQSQGSQLQGLQVHWLQLFLLHGSQSQIQFVFILVNCFNKVNPKRKYIRYNTKEK